MVGFHKEAAQAFRSSRREYLVVINHAQIYALYFPFKLWWRFFFHHSREVATTLVTGRANRFSLLRGIICVPYFFLKALPKRRALRGKALAKFLKFYFPDKKEMVVGKWGWKSTR